jgi:hypothetical protein
MKTSPKVLDAPAQNRFEDRRNLFGDFGETRFHGAQAGLDMFQAIKKGLRYWSVAGRSVYFPAAVPAAKRDHEPGSRGHREALKDFAGHIVG